MYFSLMLLVLYFLVFVELKCVTHRHVVAALCMRRHGSALSVNTIGGWRSR